MISIAADSQARAKTAKTKAMVSKAGGTGEFLGLPLTNGKLMGH
jgi:hypothetical protein